MVSLFLILWLTHHYLRAEELSCWCADGDTVHDFEHIFYGVLYNCHVQDFMQIFIVNKPLRINKTSKYFILEALFCLCCCVALFCFCCFDWFDWYNFRIAYHNFTLVSWLVDEAKTYTLIRLGQQTFSWQNFYQEMSPELKFFIRNVVYLFFVRISSRTVTMSQTSVENPTNLSVMRVSLETVIESQNLYKYSWHLILEWSLWNTLIKSQNLSKKFNNFLFS